jgi:hypothetical protein
MSFGKDRRVNKLVNKIAEIQIQLFLNPEPQILIPVHWYQDFQQPIGNKKTFSDRREWSCMLIPL